MKNLIICAAGIIFFAFNSSAQIVKTSPYEVGIHLGTSLYTGDLVPTFLGSYKSPGLFFGLDGSKSLSNAFSLRASLSFGKLKASDANYSKPEYRQQRNFSFKTPVTELSANLLWNPLGKNRTIIPYLFAGVGVSFLNIKRDYSNLNPDYFGSDSSIINGLPADIAHKLPRAIPVLPVGIGIRYLLSNKLSVNLETSYRLMSNDYLDGFSKSVDPDKKDHYFTHTVGLIYSFGEKNRLACPKK